MSLHESHALQRVFLNLSARYEDHCRASGEAESPAVCAAASRFRRDGALASLVAFVDRLEEIGISVS